MNMIARSLPKFSRPAALLAAIAAVAALGGVASPAIAATGAVPVVVLETPV